MFPGQVTMAQKPTEISPVFASYHAPVDQLVAQTPLVELPQVEYLSLPFTPSINGSGYDAGNCTTFAAARRYQIGKPIPNNLRNAIDWIPIARETYHLPVGQVPKQYAVVSMPARNPYGHVGFVESVNPDGSINISAMNEQGLGVVSYRTIPANLASTYWYLY